MNLTGFIHSFNKPVDLGKGPVGLTLLRMSLPAICMMLFNTLFFIVDTIFISRLGEAPMAAASLTFPVIIALFAVLEGVAAGTTALVGQSLGRGDLATARKIAFSGLALNYILSLCFTPMLFPQISAAVFNQIGALGDAEILRLSYEYNMWLPLTAPLIAYTFMSNSMFRCQGNTVTPFIAIALANLINGILDYVFMFEFGWGIWGAGAATFVARICAVIYIRHKMKSISLISFPLLFMPQKALAAHWKQIVSIGLPVTLATGSVALGFGGINRVLASFGHHDAVTAWMLGIRVEDFYFNVALGVSSALTPFLAFNYGRRDLPRMIEGLKAASLIAGTIMAVIGGVIFIWPHVFLGLFNPSERVMDLAIQSIRISMLAYPLVVMIFMMGSFFVATGYSIFSTAMQLIRSVIIRIPSAHFFAWWLGERGIWWFQPFSFMFGGLVAWYGYLYVVKQIQEDFSETKTN